ncbi:acyl carrier protein [Ruminiclostridium josui]|uniref:acyl carrier protein n=1 Tax=Ruminiclostridium josui TaxID=1499 RepID=UPI0006D1E7D9|nr:phosphopantetheine-binding protein [Ruminiclostridium josui]
MTENEKKIIKILEEVLALEDSGETITADSDLINDLAAESIDFIDICFRLEKDFNIGKVAVTDIFLRV